MRSSFVAAALLGWMGLSSIGVAQQLQQLPKSEIASTLARIKPSMLPADASDLQIDRNQIMKFSLDVETTLVPVRYAMPSAGGGSAPNFQCGVFFLTKDSSPTLVVTFGKDWTETASCTALKAIGTVIDAKQGATGPTIALIYMASTLRESFTQPILLTRKDGQTYQPDENLSEWVGQKEEGQTIAGIRRLLTGQPTIHKSKR